MALKDMPKVGERVRYIGSDGYSFLTAGKEYEVLNVVNVGFTIITDEGFDFQDDIYDDWELVEKSISPTNMVDSPPHYTQGDIEVIDYIDQVADSYVGRQSAYAGNIIKYVSRAPYKNGAIDIRKAIWYAQRLADAMEAEASE